MFFLLSLLGILTVERRVKVPSAKVSSGISECTHYMKVAGKLLRFVCLFINMLGKVTTVALLLELKH